VRRPRLGGRGQRTDVVALQVLIRLHFRDLHPPCSSCVSRPCAAQRLFRLAEMPGGP
jgi:hypothetical protein